MSAASWLAPTLGLMSNTPHAHGPFDVFRKTGQGAGAGVLGLNGAGALGHPQAAGLAAAPIDWSSIDGVAAALASGALNGQLQIVAAALIFLAAGRCVARMFGLGLVLFGFVAWQQGLRFEDLVPLAQSLWLRVNAAFTAFMNPPAPV